MELIKRILSDSDRKSILQIFQDIILIIIAKKNIYKTLDFYSMNLMYKKDAGDIENYVDYYTLRGIRDKYNKTEYIDDKLLDKIEQVKYLNANNIPTAHFLGELRKGVFIDNQQKTTQISNLQHLKEIIVKSILNIKTSIFIKPIGTFGGQGILKIDLENAGEQLSKIKLNQDYIIEETLIQHETLSQINPNCINTLRVYTYRKDNHIIILGCLLRMGIGDSYMDNASQGSIFIAYDINSNHLSKVARKYFKFGGQSFLKHPSSNFVFDNKPLIYPQEIKSLLQAAALVFDAPLLGWDIAYTVDGPKVIEVNYNAGVLGMQIAMRGVLSNPNLKKIFNPKIINSRFS